ncbi:MAG TPA: IS1595 family transposase [Solirubrobacteraceae bacterium]|jgi:transposase-like protein|nr:IS1595 family transposase [Solirubrobacteraceae bacterium]
MSTKSLLQGQKPPANLLEAVRYFADLDVATEFVAKLRWPNGPVCPRCGCVEYSYLTTRRVWKCKACKRQYSVKVGTIFEDSKLGLDKWLPAVWLAANSKNGVSSHELARALGITQKSAWFMLHRIRLAMQTESFLKGEVEVDETFVGGKVGYMKRDARERKGITRRGGLGQHKTAVMGFRERGSGTVHAEVIPNAKGATLKPIVAERVQDGSTIYTDQWNGYTGLEERFTHETVNHAEEYVRGRVHTNGIENFWAMLKRGLNGTYVSVDPEHLFRYVDERVFTYNGRGLTDLGRFSQVLGSVAGRRLTYAEVTGRA